MNACTTLNWDHQKDVANTTTEDAEVNLLHALEVSS